MANDRNKTKETAAAADQSANKEESEGRRVVDHSSPEPDTLIFDRVSHSKQLSRQVIQKLRGLDGNVTEEALASICKAIDETILPEMTETFNTLSAFFGNETFVELTHSLQRITSLNDEIKERIAKLKRLRPYIEAELKKPEYQDKGITVDNIFSAEPIDLDGKDKNSINNLKSEIIKAALVALNAAEEQQPIKKNAVQLDLQAFGQTAQSLTVTKRGAEKLEFPLDKINANIWNRLNEADKNGQLTLTFAAEKRGSKKEANIIYSINFDELEKAGLSTVKRLTAFDKRVYIAANAMYNTGTDRATVSQIYATMGNSGRPGAKDIEKVYESLEKMRRLPITLDSTSEHSVYKNMPKFVYNGMLLPWESVDAIVNGQRADGVIHFFREPPLMSFAKERRQITTVPRELLQSPISKTDANLQIDDYLIDRIARIKKSGGKSSNKLLYSTIYENCEIKTRMQRSRAKDKITKYLDYYKECGFIKDFKEAADGVIIRY